MKDHFFFCSKAMGPLMAIMFICSCSPPSEKTTPQPGVAIEETKPAMHAVEIAQMKFLPAVLKVRKGDTVMFVNHDMVTHDITEETKKAWSSSALAANQTWVLIVTGSAGYFCSIHPVMKGRIIME